ncbi:MAG: 50S ribosomal protein L1 [Rickettsiales bacterium]
MKISKRIKQSYDLFDRSKQYTLDDAVLLLKQMPCLKFDVSLEASFNLGVDPRHSDQMVRGAVVLPHGIGKVTRVAVITGGVKSQEAEKAGADIVGLDDVIEEIKKGNIAFDRCIATPDAMTKLAQVGRILGPKGLMPNPKLGTVTNDVAEAVKNAKLGQVDFKTEKKGILHAPFGKISFDNNKIKENFLALSSAILKLKPKAVKSNYVKSFFISATMLPSIAIVPSELQ